VKAWAAMATVSQTGYVKLNDNIVWPALNIIGDDRGVNIILVDPYNCSELESQNFDTWELNSTGLPGNHPAAVELRNYLQSLKDGSIIVGVTSDDATRNLHSALAILRQFGVEVGDVNYRGSFVFVAQKGYPAKTVMRKVQTEQATLSNPAHLNTTITGINLRSAYNERAQSPC